MFELELTQQVEMLLPSEVDAIHTACTGAIQEGELIAVQLARKGTGIRVKNIYTESPKYIEHYKDVVFREPSHILSLLYRNKTAAELQSAK
jgi:hypothetical protein